MKSHFEYHRPVSVDDAVRLHSDLGDCARFWAGGTDLVLQWKREIIKPLHCIDVTALRDLRFIDDKDANLIRIGSLCTLAGLEKTASRDPWLKTLADVARMMCTVQTRTIATAGGNLCNASPAGDLIPILIAMGAYLEISGPDGGRQLAVEELMTAPGRTSLQPAELLTTICIPRESNPRAGAYRRIDRTVVDIALVGAAAAVAPGPDGELDGIRIALGAVAPTVIRSPRAEAVFAGVSLGDVNNELVSEAGEAAALDATPISDIRASAEYRSAMVKVLVRRVLGDISSSLRGQE